MPKMNIKRTDDYYQHSLMALTAQGIGIWKYTPHTKDFYFLNDLPIVLGLTQIGIGDSLATGFEEYVHPEDLPGLHAAMEEASRCGGGVVNVKYRYLGTQGRTILVEDNIFAYRESEEESSFPMLTGYSRNINETHDQEIIHALENRFEKFLKASPGFIFIFDDAFIFRDVFISEGETLLHSLKELVGVDAHNIFSPEVCELYTNNIHGCLKDGKLREIEYYLDMNDVRYYFQARIVPFEGNRVLALISDIGDRVRRIKELTDAKGKAEEADRMKSTFLANMSHEIRTPLNAIVGFSEIIVADEDNENREEYVEIIRTNSSLLLQLINDILDISRIEAGKNDINLKDTEVCTLIDEISQVHSVKMKPGVELITIRPEGKIWLSTDPLRLKQILYNFLSNAIKNTEKGSITIRLDVMDDDSLNFTVIDTGRGIEEDKIETIFNRFEKLNSFSQGTGLGLSISKSLIEHLGGSVKVTSIFGVGSAFSFNLPFRQTQDTSLKISPQDPLRKISNKKKLLVVEPVDADYEFITIALDGTYDMIRVSCEKEAVDLFSAERFNLVLMNIPSSADAVVEAVKKIYSILPDIPIIAVVEHGHYTERQLALKAGCIDVVTRPYSASNLREAIIAHI